MYFAGHTPHVIIPIEQKEPRLLEGFHDILRMIAHELEQFQQLA
jgi:hypothetical protein